MSKKKTISHNNVVNRLSYDPVTGDLVWKSTNKKAGYINSYGYRIITFNQIPVLAHQLTWFYLYGVWADQIDHIDGNKINNIISNLRLCTTTTNQYNTSIRADNTSGFKGVYLNKKLNKYVSMIRINGKRKYLGIFSNAKDAFSAYCVEAKRIHGSFYRP